MDFGLENIFRWLPIQGPTINNVFLPVEFVILCYVVIISSFFVSLLFLVSKKYGFINAIKKSILLSLFISGIFYAIHADSGWSKWLISDYNSFFSNPTQIKLLRLDGHLYLLSNYLKELIPQNYTILSPYSEDDYPVARLKYFLLPLKSKQDAPFIIVLEDPDALFDPTNGTLTKGDLIINDLEILFRYSDYTYLLIRKVF